MQTNPLDNLVYLHAEIGDLYHFNKEVLGYRAMQEEPHRLMCDSVQYGGKRQLHLWPRGHFKSTCITVGGALREISYNPNTRIFIGNVVLGNAKSFLREIKGHLENNEKLRAIIGDQVNKEAKWTEDQIIVKGRTKNLKEPTIQVAGVGQSLASQHYDVMFLDDLVDLNSVNTPEQIAKTIEWYKMCLSLLEPDGKLIIIGTRYHYNDLYGYLIQNHADEFAIQVHSVYNEQKQPIFPARFTPEVIASLRKNQGSYLFSCNYLNDPTDDENSKFKKSQIKYYEPQDLEGKQLYTTYTIDRGYSLNKTADSTAHVIVSTDLENNWYVRLALKTKELEGALINRIFENKEYFGVDKVGIEQLAFNDTIKPSLEDEMRRRNAFFTVEELKGRAAKVARIEGLVPRFEAGTIYIQKDMQDLEDELLRFPGALHDDLADALAYQLDIARKPTDGNYRKKTPIYSATGRVIGYK